MSRLILGYDDLGRQLPSDSTSRWTPLLLAIHFPLSGVLRTCTD
ncbi:hypothetical protein [Petrimonas sp.]